MIYKVWVQIEAQPDHGEPYNMDEEVDVAVVSTLKRARNIVQDITNRYCDLDTIADWKARKIYPYNK
jgi:hypothetical protein